MSVEEYCGIHSWQDYDWCDMSRSRRRTPVTGNTRARSEKDDKCLANRKLRRESNRVIRDCECECDVRSCVFPEKRDVSDPWLMAKDGKHYFDKDRYPKLMRK